MIKTENAITSITTRAKANMPLSVISQGPAMQPAHTTEGIAERNKRCDKNISILIFRKGRYKVESGNSIVQIRLKKKYEKGTSIIRKFASEVGAIFFMTNASTKKAIPKTQVPMRLFHFPIVPVDAIKSPMAA